MTQPADADRHRYFEELAVTHVLGGLTQDDGRLFRSHLLECGECRARVGELRAIASDLADVERDERRVRAAKAVDTKRREAEEDELDLDEPPRPSRASRAVAIGGLLLVLALAGWNVVLRSNLSVQGANVGALQTANALLVGTSPIAHTSPTGEFRPADGARVHADQAHVFVHLPVTPADQRYVIYQLNAEREVIDQDPFRSGTSVSRLLESSPAATRLLVNRLGANDRVDPERTVGQNVLAADLP